MQGENEKIFLQIVWMDTENCLTLTLRQRL